MDLQGIYQGHKREGRVESRETREIAQKEATFEQS